MSIGSQRHGDRRRPDVHRAKAAAMRRLAFFTTAALTLDLACARPVRRPAPPPRPAAAANVSYEIDARIDEEAGRIQARARLALPASALASPRTVVLDEGAAGADQGRPRLLLEEVRAADGTRLPVEHDAGAARATVTLPAPAPGGVILEIAYSVPLDSGSVAQLGYYQYGGDTPGDLWFPDVLDGRGDRPRFRDFRVALEWPATCAVLTSGVPEGPPERSGERLRGVFVARDVAGFAVNVANGYLSGEVDAGEGQRVEYLAPPDLEAPYRQAAEEAAAAIRWYREIYGFFPVARIGIAPGVAQYRGGFAATNLFYIHRGNLTPEFVRDITAHELGHYYWGQWVLSAAPETFDWVMLGNGIWIDQLYLARRAGLSLAEQWRSPAGMSWFRKFLALGLTSRDGRLDVPAAEEAKLGFDYNTAVRHTKGAIGIYLQARALGTERFLQVQRDILRDHRHRPLSAADLAGRLQAAGAGDAAGFFAALARGDGGLGFAVTGSACTAEGASWRCQVTVSRTGALPAAVTVELRGATGGSLRRVVPGDRDRHTIEVTLPAPLTAVRLDPDGELPFANSDSPDIQRLVILALDDVGQTELFLAAASHFLARWPDDPSIADLLAKRRAVMLR